MLLLLFTAVEKAVGVGGGHGGVLGLANPHPSDYFRWFTEIRARLGRNYDAGGGMRRGDWADVRLYKTRISVDLRYTFTCEICVP